MRRPPALLILLLVAVPVSGCLDAINPLHGGMGPAAWPLEMAQVVELQDTGRTGKGVRIAVIDTGIDASHPEFEGLTIEWADLVNGRDGPYDDNGHGTHVAGIISARGRMKTVLSGFHLQGVAPDATLIVIKAIGEDGKGSETKVAEAIRIAVNPRPRNGQAVPGADVIVLSLGGASFPVFGTETEQAVNEAINQGVFVVAAAGNKPEGQSTCEVTSPASVPRAIAVGAVDAGRRLADFSCKGKTSSIPVLGGSGESDPNQKPEILAPGVGILGPWCTSCRNPNEYVEASGTSQAAPYVGGILALVLEGHPELKRKSGTTVENVKAKLAVSAAKIGPLEGKGLSAHDRGYGYGLVQAVALEAAV